MFGEIDSEWVSCRRAKLVSVSRNWFAEGFGSRHRFPEASLKFSLCPLAVSFPGWHQLKTIENDPGSKDSELLSIPWGRASPDLASLGFGRPTVAMLQSEKRKKKKEKSPNCNYSVQCRHCIISVRFDTRDKRSTEIWLNNIRK